MKKPPEAPARPEGSHPEILVTYKPAGRETLAAITDELIPLPLGYERPSSSPELNVRAPQSSSPEITVHEPQSSSPEIIVRAPQSSSPEIIVHEGTLERETLAAIVAEAVVAPAPVAAVPSATIVAVNAAATPAASVTKPKDVRPAVENIEIFEMATYVVRGADVARLSSEALRRAFVEEHLLARLPVRSMADVERVDVTPWNVHGTLVVRVWCRTDTPTRARG